MDGTCSLHDPKVRTVLQRLHAEARGQTAELARLLLSFVGDKLRGRELSVTEEAQRLRNLYVSLSPKQGTLAYMVARATGARRIVEFGTSFGVSTTYLAAAVRDNGGAIVIGSEIEPTKAAKARANLAEAGLSELVDIREGDARETLKDPGGAVDMALLDGKKELYLPIVQMLTPHLRRGAVVLADNVHVFRAALRPYVEYMRNPANGFQSVTLFLGSGTEYSLRL